jgi:hypothetical protein
VPGPGTPFSFAIDFRSDTGNLEQMSAVYGFEIKDSLLSE